MKNPFTAEAEINWDRLYSTSYEQLRLGDNLVDLEIEHIDNIINKIQNDPEPDHIKKTELDLWHKCREQALSGRRVGAGITALADMIAALGMKYDSDLALETIDHVMRTKFKAELDATIDLSILRGCFKGFDPDEEFNIAGDDVNGYVITNGKNTFYEMMLQEFPEECYKMCKYGRRNVNWSTIAPAGSVNTCAII